MTTRSVVALMATAGMYVTGDDTAFWFANVSWNLGGLVVVVGTTTAMQRREEGARWRGAS